MQFSDEDLIAYLLGDSSTELNQQIQQQLATDHGLLDRVGQLRLVLGLIDSFGSSYEAPEDLVDSTLARIDAEEAHAALHVEPAEKQIKVTGWLGEMRLRRSAMWDSTALTVCLTALCCLALPALVRVRFESRKLQCARNLQLTGNGLINYAILNPEQRFPFVPAAGPEAFAGVYAVYLQDSGANISPEQIRCASLPGYRRPQDSIGLQSIPTFYELREMALQELSLWQQVIGGDYAYSLGVTEKGIPRAPKCEGRSQFAILADTPVITSEISPGESGERFVAHDGRGINIFFEDGRVAFLSTKIFLQPADLATALDRSIHDNPFRNQQGVHEVGLHSQDASLAPSHFPPLGPQ